MTGNALAGRSKERKQAGNDRLNNQLSTLPSSAPCNSHPHGKRLTRLTTTLTIFLRFFVSVPYDKNFHTIAHPQEEKVKLRARSQVGLGEVSKAGQARLRLAFWFRRGSCCGVQVSRHYRCCISAGQMGLLGREFV